jgi:tellurite resistance protein
MPRRSFGLDATPKDTVLLLHGMMMMSDFKDDEMSPVFEAFVETIPELRQGNIDELKTAVAKLRLERPSKSQWVEALSEISSDVVKQKTLILALDIAMASGGMVDPAEDELLDQVRMALGLDLVFAEKIVDVLSIKYAT